MPKKEQHDINPQDDQTTAAHIRAQKDIDNDPDFNNHNKNDDLDEGELARVGGDTNGLA